MRIAKLALCVGLALWLPWASHGIARELLVVRGEGSYPPHEILEEGRLTGIHVEVIRQVAEGMGLSVTIESFPWMRAIYMVREGQADAITFIARTDEREEFAIFLEDNVLSHMRIALFALKENAGRIGFDGDLRRLEGVTIGAIRGYFYTPEFNGATFLTRDWGAEDERQLMAKLLEKRFPVAIGPVSVMTYIARRMGVEHRIQFLTPYLSEIPSYIAFSKKRNNRVLCRRFAKALVRFRRTAGYREILGRYGYR